MSPDPAGPGEWIIGRMLCGPARAVMARSPCARGATPVARAWRILLAVALASTSACAASPAVVKTDDAKSPLALDRMIALPDVKGRIDHLALDPARRHLFVAEYGNGSVDEIDLVSGRVLRRIAGLHQPQGVAYVPSTQEIVVASGDGTVRFYAVADRREVARIDLGDDADDIRTDERNGHVIVGYGSGGLATVDPETHRVLTRLLLPGHPEGFALNGPQVFVNIPDRGAILAVDLDQNRALATWSTGLHRLNFPMAVGPGGGWIAVAFRLPAALQFLATDTGRVLDSRPICGDADDLFVDHARIVVICGAGHVDITPLANEVGDTVRVATAPGARTGLYSPELDRLFVAVPARGTRAAAIWVLVPRKPEEKR